MIHVIVFFFAEVHDSHPGLNFGPYENPLKKTSKPSPQTEINPGVEKKSSRSVDNTSDSEPKVSKKNKKNKKKTIDEPAASKRLFSGQAVWGPSGYAKYKVRSESVDSNSKSDSSSRSTESDNVVVKTSAKVRNGQN